MYEEVFFLAPARDNSLPSVPRGARPRLAKVRAPGFEAAEAVHGGVGAAQSND